MSDKPKGLALILGGGKPPTEDDGDDEGGESMSAFDEYADDVFAALKSGDKAGFADALKKAIGAC